MDYSKKINSLFRIKFNGNGESTLVGVSGLINRIGEAQAIKFFKRALASKQDKCRCKVYGGAIVTFYQY